MVVVVVRMYPHQNRNDRSNNRKVRDQKRKTSEREWIEEGKRRARGGANGRGLEPRNLIKTSEPSI